MKISISKTITAFSLLLLTTRAFSQGGFEFGVRYMIQKSALMNKSDENAGKTLDYANTLSYSSGGLAVIYKFDEHMGIEMDILHSRQGQEYSGSNMQSTNDKAYNNQVLLQASLNNAVTTGTYQAKAELNCIKIPLLFRLTTDNRRKMYYTLSAGPQLNILSMAVYEVNKKDVELTGLNITPNDAYRRVTLDGVLALGAGYNLSTHFAISAQLRLDYGFQDVEKKDVTFTYYGVTGNKYYDDGRSATHNATAALMIGVDYKLTPHSKKVVIKK